MYKNKRRITNEFYISARERVNLLKEIYRKKEEGLKKYPSGKIHIIQNKKNIQYYLRKDEKEITGTYISKTNIKLIKELLQKKYDLKVINAFGKEIKALEQLLKHSECFYEKVEKWYSSQSEEVRSLINPIEISDNDFAKLWQEKEYVKKIVPDTAPDYITDKGDQVRSKSELNIANTLYKQGIPYKYECPLTLTGGTVIYPDFTILDVQNRKEIYWEHRGMMDDREYAKNSVKRIKDYQKDGIYLGDRLIITEETITNPLGISEIQNMIKHYFFKNI